MSSESAGAGSTPPPLGSQIEQTNAPEAIAAYSQLQAQLHATQLAIERSLQETKAAFAQNAEAWSKGLQAVQEAFAAQRARDMEVMQKSNQVMLMVGGALAALGLFFLLLVACFQWSMSRGLAEISAALPAALGLVRGPDLDALGLAEQATVPLLGSADPHGLPHLEPNQPGPPDLRPHRTTRRSIGRMLFPRPGDSLRRQQFRALMFALLLGLIFAAAMALMLYLIYKAPKT